MGRLAPYGLGACTTDRPDCFGNQGSLVGCSSVTASPGCWAPMYQVQHYPVYSSFSSFSSVCSTSAVMKAFQISTPSSNPLRFFRVGHERMPHGPAVPVSQPPPSECRRTTRTGCVQRCPKRASCDVILYSDCRQPGKWHKSQK